ncbi:protein Wnt-7b [Bacillus rossius redtenbacheri]|uniref:protein Wnt-7b n=1 Tax=Bacillus rossius redtenbacheri TaxID=93214 RepID=UPI002FDDCE0E
MPTGEDGQWQWPFPDRGDGQGRCAQGHVQRGVTGRDAVRRVMSSRGAMPTGEDGGRRAMLTGEDGKWRCAQGHVQRGVMGVAGHVERGLTISDGVRRAMPTGEDWQWRAMLTGEDGKWRCAQGHVQRGVMGVAGHAHGGYGKWRAMSSVVALGAHVVCSRIPGLTARQRELCRAAPDALVATGDGARLGLHECQHQFRQRRWNCSAVGSHHVFGHVVVVGSREAAYVYAATSAGVTYAVAAACSRGNISACGCDRRRRAAAARGWKWGGCSVDVGHGARFARRFLDAREVEGDARSLMNLHNNRAGRKAVRASLRTECKCHGVSGSCTIRTCWRTLPAFRQVGDLLQRKYSRARAVAAAEGGKGGKGGLRLVLRRPEARRGARGPRKADLVYLQESPNYCEPDLERGSLGTHGRRCNRTSPGLEGCNLLCCGRGYNTHQFTRVWQCRCKFHWCCYVNCDTCREDAEEYTCK